MPCVFALTSGFMKEAPQGTFPDLKCFVKNVRQWHVMKKNVIANSMIINYLHTLSVDESCRKHNIIQLMNIIQTYTSLARVACFNTLLFKVF